MSILTICSLKQQDCIVVVY